MYVDLTDAVVSANRIYKASKDPFTHDWRLTQDAAEAFGKKRASMEDILRVWITEWKNEGRLSANGLVVKVSKGQAGLLGLVPDTVTDIYDVCGRMGCLFDRPKN